MIVYHFVAAMQLAKQAHQMLQMVSNVIIVILLLS